MKGKKKRIIKQSAKYDKLVRGINNDCDNKPQTKPFNDNSVTLPPYWHKLTNDQKVQYVNEELPPKYKNRFLSG